MQLKYAAQKLNIEIQQLLSTAHTYGEFLSWEHVIEVLLDL